MSGLCEGASLAPLNARPSAQPLSVNLIMMLMMMNLIMMTVTIMAMMAMIRTMMLLGVNLSISTSLLTPTKVLNVPDFDMSLSGSGYKGQDHIAKCIPHRRNTCSVCFCFFQ